MSEPGSQGQPDDATVDLLVKQVTEGLSSAEQRALDVLDSASISGELHGLERAAAALSLAAPMESLPPALRTRLEQQAHTFAASANVRPIGEHRAAPAEPRQHPRSGRLGWFAAAACLLLAMFAWLRPPAPVVPVAQVPPPAVEVPRPAPPAPPTAAEERAALMAKADSIKITLSPTKDPTAAGVAGDVVWDPASQRGFLRFTGLAPNDPSIRQYQIWIFDGTRDKRYPVDGGVFDVPANAAEVIIPIHAALLVHKPAAFAVTVEKPGGVVVSARDHVVVLGAAG